jgi:hypothetical protein
VCEKIEQRVKKNARFILKLREKLLVKAVPVTGLEGP